MKVKDEEIEKLMYCSPKHGFFFLAIPKVATTSLITWMLRMEGIPFNEQTYINGLIRKRLMLRNHGLDPLAIFSFTFVRNPWIRLASAYLDKFVKDRKTPHIMAIRITEAMGRKKTGITFREFVENHVAKTDLNQCDVHWRIQYHMVQYAQPKFIGRFEKIQKDFDFVMEKIGTTQELDHLNKSQTSVIKPTPALSEVPALKLRQMRRVSWQSIYTPDLVERVGALYAEDVKAYDYQSPFNTGSSR